MSAALRQGRTQAPSPSAFRVLDDRNNRQEDVKPVPPRHSDGPSPPANRRNITTSMSSFFNKLRPSKRPEKGGTVRHKSNSTSSTEAQKGSSIPIRATSNVQSTGPDGSDVIPASRWNMPIPIPRRTESTRTTPGKQRTSSLPRLTINTSGLNKSNPPHVQVEARDWAPAVNSTAKRSNIPTLRPTQPTADTREMFLAKQELRQQRRTLKQSGDFLGVTSINPHTGVMDVITPTTSSEDATVSLSSPTDSHLATLAHTAQDAREAYVAAKAEAQVKKEHKKAERRKEAVRTVLNQHGGNVVWRKEGEAWSYVAEPDLSPIPQSQRSFMSPDTSDSEATTIHRTPISVGPSRGPFLGMAPTALVARPSRLALQEEDINQPVTSTPHRHQTHKSVEEKTEASKPKSHALPRPRSLRFSLPPMVPRRVSSGRPDTNKSADGLLEEQQSRGHSFKQRWLRYSLPGSRIPPRITSSKSLELENVNPADLWATRLIEDLSCLDESNQAHATAMELWGMPPEEGVSSKNDDQEPQSAYTPIITTTGFGHDQPPLLVDGRPCDEPADDGWRDGPRSVMSMIMEDSTPTSPMSLTPTPSSAYSEAVASPLTTQPNSSRSVEDGTLKTTATTTVITELEVAVLPSARDLLPSPPEPEQEIASTLLTPDTETTAEEAGGIKPQDTTTETDDQLRPKEMRKTMRKENREEDAGIANMHTPSPSSPKFTSIVRHHPHHQPPAQLVDGELDQAIARGAARTAFTHLILDQPELKTEPQPLPKKEPTSCDRTRTVPVPVSASAWLKRTTMSDRRLPRGAEAKAKAAAEPEGGRDADHSRDLAPLETLAGNGQQQTVTKEGGDGKGVSVGFMGSLKVGDVCREVVSWFIVVLGMIARLVAAYWRMVRPVFEAESELRKRFQLAESTWEDCGVGVSAVVFLFGGLSAGMWLVRGFVWFVRLVKAVGKGLAVVAGIPV
ncbi:hypothetical protein QBC40DRAFT_312702 [Triangularia verruculosa]|uniref:Uncharacterized protein n=1 Tax=Triangularia verruculosa TaxID=2587418 RepID=A0AAN6XFH1_9PEZI|nr:hypothetical protein QBC40DRAFT_312702 [Triangularia verruculosa]